MSKVLGFSSDRDKTRRKSCQRRNDSGELDVFDAEDYFSSINESLGHELGIAIRDDCNSTSNSNRQGWREGRVSLDIPAMRYTNNHHYHHHHHHHHHYNRQHSVSQTQSIYKEKKHKQPSSPGGKLASFFNSLINQAKKKKSSSKSTSSQTPILEEDRSPSGWKRRTTRSSNISNFSSSNTSTTSTRTRTTNTSVDVDTPKQTKSFSGISVFRSSPPYPINTPTKSTYKDFKCKNTTTKVTSDANLDWLDEKFKCIGVKQPNKGFDDRHQISVDKERSWVGRNSSVESGGFKKFTEDDGGESDSSSDLFELQLNYECSSGLPVYESTCMDSIKRSTATPITNI